jgi:hypothetical protein
MPIEAEIELNQEEIEALGRKFKDEFTYNEALRRDKEIDWAANLRQFKGIYDPTVVARFDKYQSRVYPKYTRSKVMMVLSRLNSLLFSEYEDNWEISPTPKPVIKPSVLRQLELAVKQSDQASQEELDKMIDLYVEKACNRMRTQIKDQFEELRYREMSKQVIFSGILYGTGVIKGPLSHKSVKKRYRYQMDRIVPEIYEEYTPYLNFVPIWDLYPDMSANHFGECGFFYERHAMTKHEMRDLAKREDFDSDIINDYLRQHAKGDTTPRPWESDLQDIGNKNINIDRYVRYEVLERWGYVDGDDLEKLGLLDAGQSSDFEYLAQFWLLGPHVIKAVVVDLIPYNAFYFEKDESSIFGEGLPSIIDDTQEGICASTRMLLDNAASVAGPQLEVNYDLLMPGQNTEEFHARKVWHREGRGNDANYPAIRGLEFNSHIDELIGIINLFREFGDEESTFPTSGLSDPNRTTNETAKGVSMRMSNIQLTIRDIVKHFDECNENIIKSMYAWNMEYSEDESLKGDFTVKARGASSLVSKEIRAQSLDYFASTLQPEDAPFIKRGDFLKERMKVHDIDPEELLRNEQEAAEWIDQQRDKEAEILAKKMQMAEIDYTHSKSMHMLSKAKGENLESKIKGIDAIQGKDENDTSKRSK